MKTSGTGDFRKEANMELDVATVAMVMGIGMGFKLVEQVEPRLILERILRPKGQRQDDDPKKRPSGRLAPRFRADDEDEVTEPRKRVDGPKDSEKN